MGPRHFPSPISIGTDICKSARFSKYIPSSSDASLQAYGASLRSPKSEKAHQAYLKIEPTSGLPKPLFALLDRIFTPPEQRQFWETWGRLSPLRKWPDGMAQIDEGQRERITKYLGGRWAAKEAIIKAYARNRRQLYMRDVEIRTRRETGAPFGLVLDSRYPKPSPTSTESPSEVDWETSGLHRMIAEAGRGGFQADQIWAQWKIQDIRRRRRKARVERPREGYEGVPAEDGESRGIFTREGVLDFGAVAQALNMDRGDSATEEQPQGLHKLTPDEDDAQDADTKLVRGEAATEEQPHGPHKLTPDENDDQNADTGFLSELHTTTPEPPDIPFFEDLDLPTSVEEDTHKWVEQDKVHVPFPEVDGQIVQVSISHDGDYCFATCLAPILDLASEKEVSRSEKRLKFWDKRNAVRGSKNQKEKAKVVRTGDVKSSDRRPLGGIRSEGRREPGLVRSGEVKSLNSYRPLESAKRELELVRSGGVRPVEGKFLSSHQRLEKAESEKEEPELVHPGEVKSLASDHSLESEKKGAESVRTDEMKSLASDQPLESAESEKKDGNGKHR